MLWMLRAAVLVCCCKGNSKAASLCSAPSALILSSRPLLSRAIKCLVYCPPVACCYNLPLQNLHAIRWDKEVSPIGC